MRFYLVLNNIWGKTQRKTVTANHRWEVRSSVIRKEILVPLVFTDAADKQLLAAGMLREPGRTVKPSMNKFQDLFSGTGDSFGPHI
jgi:hypothetical protein